MSTEPALAVEGDGGLLAASLSAADDEAPPALGPLSSDAEEPPLGPELPPEVTGKEAGAPPTPSRAQAWLGERDAGDGEADTAAAQAEEKGEEAVVDGEEDVEEGPTPVDAGNTGQGRRHRNVRDRTPTDTSPLSRSMVLHLAKYMEKSAAKASENMQLSISKRIPTYFSDQGGRGGNREQQRVPQNSAPETLQAVIEESKQMVEQVARSEKQAAHAMKKAVEPEAVKAAAGGKPVKDVIEKELAKFRDTTLPKAVLKAAEGRAFADHFSDGLAASPPEAAPLREALQPTKQQLQEALQTDLSQWCTGAVAKRCSKAVQDIGLPQATRAIEAAMKEVTSQTTRALDRILDETKAKADAKCLSEVCAASVSATVRREVQKWEEELLQPRQHASPSQGLSHAAREGFSRRMRQVAAPLQRDLDGAARDLELAGFSLQRCRAHADALEAAAGTSRSSTSGARGRTFSEERDGVLEAAAAGRLREAFERALKWDSQKKDDSTSLVENLCQHLCPVAGDDAEDEPAALEEFLARPEVVTEMDGRLRLLLTSVLLQRSVLHDASLERIEANLEWAFGFLGSIDVDAEGAQALPSSVEAVRPGAREALEQLRKGERPAALAEAGAAKRKKVAATARLALKTLDSLARLKRRA